MTPYYQDDAVTIYHGDCREWMPEADVIITDPPYGIGWQQHGGGVRGQTRNSRKHRGIVGDLDTSLRDYVLAQRPNTPAAVFGSWRAPFPVGVKQVLVYQKAPSAGLMGSVTGFRTDTEPIFLVGPWPRRTVRWSSVLASNIGPETLQVGNSHPHAKPVDVMARLIEAIGGIILDPFMGTGATLVAAKRLHRWSIGIEIEERYCEIAANRCRQEVLGLVV